MDDELEDGGGFDADDWSRLTPFVGVVATLDDVQARRAVFALGDTDDPRCHFSLSQFPVAQRSYHRPGLE